MILNGLRASTFRFQKAEVRKCKKSSIGKWLKLLLSLQDAQVIIKKFFECFIFNIKTAIGYKIRFMSLDKKVKINSLHGALEQSKAFLIWTINLSF